MTKASDQHHRTGIPSVAEDSTMSTALACRKVRLAAYGRGSGPATRLADRDGIQEGIVYFTNPRDSEGRVTRI
jgi:hypothetical protein